MGMGEGIKKSKILRRWIISFVLILVIITVVLFVVHYFTFRIFSDEILELNKHSTQFVQQVTDRIIGHIETIAIEIELNETNLRLSQTDDPAAFKTRDAYELLSYIRNYSVANRFLKTIFIYYPKTHYIVGNEGIFPAASYYILQNNLSIEGYEAWKKELSNPNTQFFFQRILGNDLHLCYRHSLFSTTNSRNKESVFIAGIDKEELQSLLGMINQEGRHKFVGMLSSESDLYAYSGNLSLLDQIASPDIVHSNQTCIKNRKIIVTRVSENGNIAYVTVNNISDLLRRANSLQRLSYVSLLLCFLIGIIYAVFVSRKNTRPIRSVVSLLDQANVGKSDVSSDEYHYITSAINQILEDNQDYINELEEKQQLVNQVFIDRILSSGQFDDRMIYAIAQRCGVEFDFPYFAVSVFLYQGETLRSELRNDILGFLRSQAEKLNEETNTIFFMVGEIKTVFILLANLDNATDLSQMAILTQKICSLTEKELGLTMNCGTGKIYDRMSSIFLSFHEAFGICRGELREERIQEYAGNDSFIQFLHAMLDEDYHLAKQLVADLFTHYLCNDTTYLEYRKYAVINQVLEAVYLAEKEYPNFTSQRFAKLLLLSEFSLEQLRGVLIDILSELGDLSSQKDKQNVSIIVQRIKSVIKEKYKDPMLGLYYISNELNVSSSYVSKRFKQETGQGVVEYINRTRIEAAKHLAAGGSKSIKEIACCVGFLSDINFIRVFKKYVALTPGEYKRQCSPPV
jgi:AraC-like DNA-binding protein/predicted PurR-regulated permease PerM